VILFTEVLTTTPDYLVAGSLSESTPVNNARLLLRLQLIDQFDAEEKEIVISVLDAMIAERNIDATA
jgi:hypothetical protein